LSSTKSSGLRVKYYFKNFQKMVMAFIMMVNLSAVLMSECRSVIMDASDLTEVFSSEGENPKITDKPKKRRKIGRNRDVAKRERLSNHVTGPNCSCRRKCTELLVTNDQRVILLQRFNAFASRNEQDAYLSGLIRLIPIARRRFRRDNAIPNESSYKYTVRVVDEGGTVTEIVVCYTAFCSIHGITKSRVCTLKHSLVSTGQIHTDKRGLHANRPRSIPKTDRDSAREHIASFKSRKAHYSRGQHRKVYLPEELNVKAMYRMFKVQYVNSRVKYGTYLHVFNTEFNIGFGYPRCDTCSTCDAYLARMKDINEQLKSATSAADKIDVDKLKKKLKMEQDLHKRKAETFYERKRSARQLAQSDKSVFAFAMDYSKNVHAPNLSTNDVYYKRQLSVYLFNIHVLSTKASYFYSYDETVANKGADEVVSILDHFIANNVPADVKQLEIFCDSCPGQNKNYTVFRYLHHIVATIKRFECVKVTFPIRGHSYMECDKNMALINQKAHLETPDDWRRHIETSRINPSPFVVINCLNAMFNAYTKYFKPVYKPSCPFATRPVRDFMVKSVHPQLVYVRNNYNGSWKSHIMLKRVKRVNPVSEQPKLGQSRCVPIPLTKAKYNDICALSKFCSQSAATFYRSLPYIGQDDENETEEADTEVASDMD
jgi:hypothetical protein